MELKDILDMDCPKLVTEVTALMFIHESYFVEFHYTCDSFLNRSLYFHMWPRDCSKKDGPKFYISNGKLHTQFEGFCDRSKFLRMRRLLKTQLSK